MYERCTTLQLRFFKCKHNVFWILTSDFTWIINPTPSSLIHTVYKVIGLAAFTCWLNSVKVAHQFILWFNWSTWSELAELSLHSGKLRCSSVLHSNHWSPLSCDRLCWIVPCFKVVMINCSGGFVRAGAMTSHGIIAHFASNYDHGFSAYTSAAIRKARFR